MIRPETKVCTKCNIKKSAKDFYIDKRFDGAVRAKCKVCMNKLNLKWCATDEGKISVKKTITKYINSEHGKLKRKNYYESPEGQEAYKRADIKYRNSSEGRIAIQARSAYFRALKIQATPQWLNDDHLKLIEMYYQLAYYMTKVTGIRHQVDHIIPLNGKNVRGLHVPWNLRVITAKENRNKGNKIL